MEKKESTNYYYDAQIKHYQGCSRLLQELDKNKSIAIGLVACMSGCTQFPEKAIEELISIGAARRDDGDNLVQTDSTHPLNVRGYFNERINELQMQKRLEELHERSVSISEKSAHAAEESAKSAKCANTISKIAIVVSVISSIINLFLSGGIKHVFY